MNPPKGYYRNLISDSNVRIAFTHTPIHGCSIIDNTQTINELEKSNDPHSQYYINGLKSGSMVTIVENNIHDRYFRTGELYFNN